MVVGVDFLGKGHICQTYNKRITVIKSLSIIHIQQNQLLNTHLSTFPNLNIRLKYFESLSYIRIACTAKEGSRKVYCVYILEFESSLQNFKIAQMDIQHNPLALKYKDQGNQAYKSQDYNKAIQLYTRAIQIQEDANFYSNRALCYFNLNRYQECIKDCDRATRLNPQLAKAFKKKSQACIQLLRFESAVDAAKANANIEKNITASNQLQEVESLKNNFDRYQYAERQNNYTQALSCVSYLVNKIPNNNTLKLYKVQCLAKTGEINQASNLLNSLHNENTPAFYYLKGIIQLYNGDSNKAKKFFAEGIRLDPQNVKCQRALNKANKCETYKQEGNELIKAKKYKQAELKYTQALNLDPYNKKLNSIIYSNRGLCFMKLGQRIKALQDLNKSLELDPNYLKSLVRRAELNMEREDYTAALHDYTKIQQLDPNANMKPKIEEAKKKERQAKKKKDYYAILGVAKNATDAEIKKAYKALALKYHPDRNRGKSDVEQDQASKKFKDIAEAHGVLTDPEKRKRYDCGQMDFDGDLGAEGFQNVGGMGNMGNVKFTFNGTDMSGMGIDPSQIFSMFFNNDRGSGFEGFQSYGFGGRMGGNRQKSNNRGSSRPKGFPGFGSGFSGFSNFGFSQKGSNSSHN